MIKKFPFYNFDEEKEVALITEAQYNYLRKLDFLTDEEDKELNGRLPQIDVIDYFRCRGIIIALDYGLANNHVEQTANAWSYRIFVDSGKLEVVDGKTQNAPKYLYSEIAEDSHEYSHEEAVGRALSHVLCDEFMSGIYESVEQHNLVSLPNNNPSSEGDGKEKGERKKYYEVERYLIGAMLVDKDCAESGVSTLSLYKWHNEEFVPIFNAISKLVKKGSAVHVVSVIDEMRLAAEEVPFLMECSRVISTTKHFENYVRMVMNGFEPRL